MNSKEEELGRVYRQWTDVIDIIRTDLNEIRLRPDGNPKENVFAPSTDKLPKFKIDDIVYFKLERPMNAWGNINLLIIFVKETIDITLKIHKK